MGFTINNGVAKVSNISGYTKRIMRKIHKKRRGTSHLKAMLF